MFNLSKILFSALFVCLVIQLSAQSGRVVAQRPILSTNYLFNGMLPFNPAYAGNQQQLNVTAVHRDQWVNFPGAPNTQVLSAHAGIKDNRIGVGVMFLRDEHAINEDFSAYGIYSYRIKLPIGALAMGLQAGVDFVKADYTQLELKNPDDIVLSGFEQSFNPNFGVGVYYSTKRVYASLSIPYILNNRGKILDENNNISESQEKRYYFIGGGVVLDVNDDIKFKPSTLIRFQENAHLGFEVNGTFIVDDRVNLGFGYRHEDALMALFGLELNENLAVGYSYGYPVNVYAPDTKGTHEIMLTYRLDLTPDECHSYF